MPAAGCLEQRVRDVCARSQLKKEATASGLGGRVLAPWTLSRTFVQSKGEPVKGL